MTDIDTIEETLQAGDTVRLGGIAWDVDDTGDGGTPTLPETVVVTLPDGWQTGDSLADLLSDEHGFCVNGIAVIEKIVA